MNAASNGSSQAKRRYTRRFVTGANADGSKR